MLDKLRELRRLKKQMEAIEIEEEVNGVRVKMDGAMKVLGVSIANKDDRKLEKNVRKAFNKTLKAIQKKMAQDMMGSGGGLF
ncbi:MAG: YbaB/EbfC family nucleoid-associated protein [Patescibacteria group bacterium]|nr:YbaB/EbfC family nucleoid-associated protein [Patescibacteria group bacterium]